MCGDKNDNDEDVLLSKPNIDTILDNELELFFNNIEDLDFNLNLNLNIDFEWDDNLFSDCSIEPIDITQPNFLNMFPHMADEKNLKRRPLLYENTTETINHSLLSHDYTMLVMKSNAGNNNNNATKRRNEEEKYPCTYTNCNKVYTKLSHLKAHLKRHSGEKPFACNWENCTWRFSRSDELARHKRSHSGIKPYKCDLCERAFARSDHLSKHHKVHKKKMAQFGSYHIKKKLR